ncbi:aldehyde dehydrogenase family protein [Streptacidiphilus sp. EB103A]|uniref:aldehyde dehydrogenase family protein n=1 Tax=Streptacidiphilus sp. EB103A TaxID=3156275 RepID=UPI00351354ED
MTGLLVDGVWRSGEAAFAVEDKYTRRSIATVQYAEPADVDEAVAGAVAAAEHPLPPARRHEILSAAAQLLQERREQVAAVYVAETGFTPADADTELTRAVAILRLSAEESVRIAGEEVPVAATPGSENRLAFTIRVPVGVVGAITPFNAPLNTVVHKVAPALAAGNAVVLKPALQTPLCSVLLAGLLLEAGLPPGLLQLVCGPGSTVGAALVADRRIRFFTFTGSTAVGLSIKQNSGIAKTHLELGSNSASIVAADADLELVADQVTRAGYRKAGQVCTSVQRLIAHASVVDELAALLAERVGALRSGDPRSPDVQVGPLIAEAEAERAHSWIRQAVHGGAALLAGGERDGAVLTPTLLLDPPADSRIMTEEIFAPAVALVGAADLDQAIDLVNSGPYGLQAGLFTRDLDAAFHALRRLRVGGVMVNDTSSYHADAMPYGGVKGSGYGLEGPRYAVQEMTDPRIVVFNLREGTWR